MSALPPLAASFFVAPALRRPLLPVLAAHALLAALLLRGASTPPLSAPTPLSVRMVAAPAPRPEPLAPAQATPREPAPRQPRAHSPALISTPAPTPASSASAVPPAPSLASEAAAPSAPKAAAAEPAAPNAPASAPRFDADYLNNPAPPYPPLSRKLGETGRVLLRVAVDAEGRAAQVELHASSGHARLDQAAMQAVRRWSFVPARQGGQAVAASVLVPIVFSLRD